MKLFILNQFDVLNSFSNFVPARPTVAFQWYNKNPEIRRARIYRAEIPKYRIAEFSKMYQKLRAAYLPDYNKNH